MTACLSAAPFSVFDEVRDVGDTALPGATEYRADDQSTTLTGSGANMWADRDAFRFAGTRVEGDFVLQALTEFVGAGVDPHRKLGLIARVSLDPGSAHVNVCRHGDGLMSFQFRRTPGGPTEEVRFEVTGAEVLQLVRRGDTFTASVARFGETFVSQTLTGVVAGAALHVGLYVCSHNNTVRETAVFRNVRLVRPAKIGFAPYREYLASAVETLDVATGWRRVHFTTPDSAQAPNWTPDGRELIYNRNGRIHAYALARGESRLVDTGDQVRNNNDHALSFDGRRLGISSGQPSTIYVLPVEGGAPRQVTRRNPSYLHGWSPDGRHLVYTGIRGPDADIYRIAAEGGEEERLTDAPGLDDGSEYTPDGRTIYFNSERTGRMQIWKMRADGSGQEPVTADAFNNWFPHVSPDGRTIVFLSYGPHVRSGDHPFYEHVYLRKLDLTDGRISVVAYVYGGQGSINVNSWAPDSRRLAFVSNGDPLTAPGR
jgi:Tol biopolymer transport system component